MKKKSSLYKIFLFIIITILLISTAYYLYNQKITVLKIIDYKENKTIWSSEVKEDEQFTIKYLHSVARTPVLEIFAIRSGDIVLTSTEYQSYGAGLPFLDQHEYLLEDDKFIIRKIDKKLPDIMLRVSDYALHEFIFKNENYKLYNMVKTETLLKFKTEDINYIHYHTEEVQRWLKTKLKKNI